jgi:hypothetical protein
MFKLVSFISTAIGKWFNPDNAHGYQCKDLIDALCIFLWGSWVDTVRPGNGNAVFANANPAYFTKVANDPGNPNQLPPFGSVLSFAGSAAVPEGHTAIALWADQAGVTVLQMNGYTQVAAHLAVLPYDGLIGWLVPKLNDDGVVLREVTADVAMVRTGPGTQYPLAAGYEDGLAKGAQLAVIGYAKGSDPYDDGVTDDAWYVTRSGYFVWANAAGDNIDGLVWV